MLHLQVNKDTFRHWLGQSRGTSHTA